MKTWQKIDAEIIEAEEAWAINTEIMVLSNMLYSQEQIEGQIALVAKRLREAADHLDELYASDDPNYSSVVERFMEMTNRIAGDMNTRTVATYAMRAESAKARLTEMRRNK